MSETAPQDDAVTARPKSFAVSAWAIIVAFYAGRWSGQIGTGHVVAIVLCAAVQLGALVIQDRRDKKVAASNG